MVSRGRFPAASEPPMPPQTLALRQQSSSTSTNVAGDDIVEHMEEQRFCEEGTGDAAMVRYSPLGPLTKMQKKVAKCMALAHAAYADSPQVAAEVRRSAIICRTAQVESAALLRRVQQTADSVLDLIPDLQLAVTEMEPELAMEFFQTVRKWVQRLTDEITRVQGENKNSLLALSNAFEAVATSSVADARPQLESGAEVAQPKRKLGRLNSGRDLTEENAAPDGPARKLSGGEAQSPKPDVRSRLRRLVRRFTGRSTDSALSTSSSRGGERVETPADEDAMIEAQVDAALEAPSEQQKRLLNELTDMPEEEFLDLFLSPNSTSSRMYPAEAEMPILEDAARASSTESPPTPLSRASMDLPLANTRQDSSGVADTVRALVLRDGSPVRQEAGVALQDALKNLEGVDAILHHLQNFWSSTEVIFDTLLQRSDHVERFIKFAHKPRLARRFQERLAEYTTFWQQVRSVAVECITGHCAKAAYAFLQENSVRSASETEAPRRPGTSEVEAAPVARESAL
uniref:Uncharacterized protein n=1 Tax=Pinguiococcus pyrenoidosus TaxID=172671 RepID=A0A7R9UH11_9STRA